jgi:REP element-mobilizing transposase RayT/predicted XRE-type DNA-binding protein
MPRKSRIDAPSALHHIIGRGINRQEIFSDETDYRDFLNRLGDVLSETNTSCYAWALLPNHFHLLVRAGDVPVSRVMQRLLTGYVVTYNHRHHRFGHLFQNRYTSIVCQEDPYLLELVRYIHLNPLRAKVVSDYKALGHHPYCGHSVILGRRRNDWQDDEELQQTYRMQTQGYDLQKLLQRVAEIMHMSSEEIMDSEKNRKGVQARSILCYFATDQLRISQTQLGHVLHLTQPAVSEAVKRGKQLAKMCGYSLIEENKL